MNRLLSALWVIILTTSPTLAAWKIEHGRKVMSLREDPFGQIATLQARNQSHSSAAKLQIECFISPQLRGISVGIVLSRPTAPGPLGWSYSFDGKPEVKEGPYSRTSLTVISLSDANGAIYKGMDSAKHLKLTLLPTKGPALSYDFDLTGAAEAIRKLACK